VILFDIRHLDPEYLPSAVTQMPTNKCDQYLSEEVFPGMWTAGRERLGDSQPAGRFRDPDRVSVWVLALHSAQCTVHSAQCTVRSAGSPIILSALPGLESEMSCPV
jgi:hypothetical protein